MGPRGERYGRQQWEPRGEGTLKKVNSPRGHHMRWGQGNGVWEGIKVKDKGVFLWEGS